MRETMTQILLPQHRTGTPCAHTTENRALKARLQSALQYPKHPASFLHQCRQAAHQELHHQSQVSHRHHHLTVEDRAKRQGQHRLCHHCRQKTRHDKMTAMTMIPSTTRHPHTRVYPSWAALLPLHQQRRLDHLRLLLLDRPRTRMHHLRRLRQTVRLRPLQPPAELLLLDHPRRFPGLAVELHLVDRLI
jgi:hypothetical protein